ncbi:MULTISPECIES: Hpt domain-containing protein [unclassified Roseitalea]|uniref:Hpt domain-containing protein n=1 Tax=unclassified Roseitalea TaxID=2639107 RepID=UPI00273E8ED0|nr:MULTISPECIES: Hpt domain-containing protein [unclassified Roseitalea]
MPASERPAFYPPQSEPEPLRGGRPVDLAQLARQTGGDRGLEEEVLRLFLRQSAAIARTVRGQADAESRRRNAHTLKGAARAVGARKVAERASALEHAPHETRALRALLREIDRTCDYINSLLR